MWTCVYSFSCAGSLFCAINCRYFVILTRLLRLSVQEQSSGGGQGGARDSTAFRWIGASGVWAKGGLAGGGCVVVGAAMFFEVVILMMVAVVNIVGTRLGTRSAGFIAGRIGRKSLIASGIVCHVSNSLCHRVGCSFSCSSRGEVATGRTFG